MAVLMGNGALWLTLYYTGGCQLNSHVILRDTRNSLRENCPNTEFFWCVFSRIWTKKQRVSVLNMP